MSDDAVLDEVGVLVFVDHHEAVSLVESSAEFGVFAEQLLNVQQQVVEVDGVGLEQELLVPRVDSSDDFLKVVPHAVCVVGYERFGGLLFIFCSGDGSGDASGRKVDGVEVEFIEDGADDLFLVGGIQDGVVVLESDELGVFSEQPGTEAVKGTDGNRAASGQPLDPIGHFLSRLVGEGDGEDLLWIDATFDQPSHPPGDDSGLTRPGSGEDEHRAFEVFDGSSLSGCELIGGVRL